MRRLALWAIPLLAACIDPLTCTLIGCASGLSVRAPAAATLPFTVIAREPGGATRTAQCTQSAPCLGVMFTDFQPTAVNIEVIWATGSARKDFRPTYTRSAPNGEGCGPVCFQATVSVD